MFLLIAYSTLIMLASLIGVFSVWKKLGRFIERNLGLLVSFSAGVFLIIAYELGTEALEHGVSEISGLTWIIIGVLSVWLLFKFLPSFHHHHEEGLDGHLHSALDVRRILASDALHNLADGLLLASSFALGSSFGKLTAISIFIHELVQEMSEFFVLRQAGFSTKKILVLNFFVSSTILVGALGGFFLLENFDTIELPLLGLASGAFLVVVFHDLIPHSVRISQKKNLYTLHLIWFLIGGVVMFLVNSILGH